MAFLERRGAVVQNYISAQTDILIAGHKQLNLFDPDKRSKKYEAAMSRIAEGQSIIILSEEEFFNMVKESQL
ncbi:MAG: BRCT domain-containing protein [Streptococcus suis]|nr:BRCT domain-containing protein [Streptococcus suis]